MNLIINKLSFNPQGSQDYSIRLMTENQKNESRSVNSTCHPRTLACEKMTSDLSPSHFLAPNAKDSMTSMITTAIEQLGSFIAQFASFPTAANEKTEATVEGGKNQEVENSGVFWDLGSSSIGDEFEYHSCDD